MLTITDQAGQVVSDIVGRNVTTDTGGLRIVGTPEATFAVSIAEAPSAAEIVAEHGEARVFMDLPVAEALDDKVLDATVSEDGAVQFVISAGAA